MAGSVFFSSFGFSMTSTISSFSTSISTISSYASSYFVSFTEGGLETSSGITFGLLSTLVSITSGFKDSADDFNFKSSVLGVVILSLDEFVWIKRLSFELNFPSVTPERLLAWLGVACPDSSSIIDSFLFLNSIYLRRSNSSSVAFVSSFLVSDGVLLSTLFSSSIVTSISFDLASDLEYL